jgi:hypothetical protein
MKHPQERSWGNFYCKKENNFNNDKKENNFGFIWLRLNSTLVGKNTD